MCSSSDIVQDKEREKFFGLSLPPSLQFLPRPPLRHREQRQLSRQLRNNVVPSPTEPSNRRGGTDVTAHKQRDDRHLSDFITFHHIYNIHYKTHLDFRNMNI